MFQSGAENRGICRALIYTSQADLASFVMAQLWAINGELNTRSLFSQ